MKQKWQRIIIWINCSFCPIILIENHIHDEAVEDHVSPACNVHCHLQVMYTGYLIRNTENSFNNKNHNHTHTVSKQCYILTLTHDPCLDWLVSNTANLLYTFCLTTYICEEITVKRNAYGIIKWTAKNFWRTI